MTNDFANHIKLVLLIALPLFLCNCNKDDNLENTNQVNNSDPEFSFIPNGNSSRKWVATSFEKVQHLSNLTVIVVKNNGETVYSEILKDSFPLLTEKLYIILFSNNLTTGKYILKYGPEHKVQQS